MFDSEQDNEIVECDGCGASVHEGYIALLLNDIHSVKMHRAC